MASSTKTRGSHEHPCQGDCEGGFYTFECDDDGHIIHGEECESCDDCVTYDLSDATGGMYTCEPNSAEPMIAYEDNNLDGVVDGVYEFSALPVLGRVRNGG